MSQELGPDQCKALLFFHAYTGCDVTSFLKCIKKAAWSIWQSNPRCTLTFEEIAKWPDHQTLTSKLKANREEFTVLYCTWSTTQLHPSMIIRGSVHSRREGFREAPTSPWSPLQIRQESAIGYKNMELSVGEEHQTSRPKPLGMDVEWSDRRMVSILHGTPRSQQRLLHAVSLWMQNHMQSVLYTNTNYLFITHASFHQGNC